MQAAAAVAATGAARPARLRGLAGSGRPLGVRRAAPARLPAAQRTIRAVAEAERAADGAAAAAHPLKIDITQEDGSTRIVVEGTSRPGARGGASGAGRTGALHAACRRRRHSWRRQPPAG